MHEVYLTVCSFGSYLAENDWGVLHGTSFLYHQRSLLAALVLRVSVVCEIGRPYLIRYRTDLNVDLKPKKLETDSKLKTRPHVLKYYFFHRLLPFQL